MTTGLLLINLGTPDSADVADVRHYLAEFLSDPRVIDLSAPARWLLLNLIILPFRPRHSARAYREIFTERGSPLLFHSEDLREALTQELGQSWKVALGMRYGKPSIADALQQLRTDCDRVVVLPLFPQYSSAATGSALEKVMQLASALPVVPTLVMAPPFYDHPAFIEPQAALVRPLMQAQAPDHVLFTFHGLPERQIRAAHPGHCLASSSCCDHIGPHNRGCYRAHCLATARALAAAMAVPEGSWSMSFQSRLGRDPWLTPNTEMHLPALAQSGVKHVLVISPAFVADCLETLEELGIRGKTLFMQAGGQSYTLAPCVNSDPAWVRGVARLAREALGGAGQ